MLPTEDQEALAARRSLRGKSPRMPFVKAPAYDPPASRRRYSDESDYRSANDDSIYGDGGRGGNGSQYGGRSEDYESDPDDVTPVNPFGRPLPKSHASRRRSRVVNPSPETSESPDAEGGGGDGKLALKPAAVVTEGRAGRQDRDERMTATTAPSTNFTSMIGPGQGSTWWDGLKNSVLGKGLEQESIRDLGVRRVEDNRSMSKSEHGVLCASQSRRELRPHSEHGEKVNGGGRSRSESRGRSSRRVRNRGKANASAATAAFMSAAAEAFMEAGSMGEDDTNAMTSFAEQSRTSRMTIESRTSLDTSTNNRPTAPGQMDVDFPSRRRITENIDKQPWRTIPNVSEHSSEARHTVAMASDATTTGAKRSLRDEALRARSKRDKRMERAVAKSTGYSRQTSSQRDSMRSRSLRSAQTMTHSQQGSISKPGAPGFSDRSDAIVEAERRRAERLAERDAELKERWEDQHFVAGSTRQHYGRLEDAVDDCSINTRIWRGIEDMLNDAFSVTQVRDGGGGASCDDESNRFDNDRGVLTESDRDREVVQRLGDEISFAAGVHDDDRSIVSRLSMHTWRRSQRSLATCEVAAVDEDQDELEMARVALDSFLDFFSEQNSRIQRRPGASAMGTAEVDDEYHLSYVEAVRADADAARRALSGDLPPGLEDEDNSRSLRSHVSFASLKSRSTLHSRKSMVGKTGGSLKRGLPRKSLEELSCRVFAGGMSGGTSKSTRSLGSRSIGRSSETTSVRSRISGAAAGVIIRKADIVTRARSTKVALASPRSRQHMDDEGNATAELPEKRMEEYEQEREEKYRDEEHDDNGNEEDRAMAKELHDMDNFELAQTALESFVDVLLDENPDADEAPNETNGLGEAPVAMLSSQTQSVRSMYSHRTSESKATERSVYSTTEDIDVPAEKVSKLSRPSKTLFDIFRWSLRVNIDHTEKIRRQEERQKVRSIQADREEQELVLREMRGIFRKRDMVQSVDQRIRSGLPTVYGDAWDSASESAVTGSSSCRDIGESGSPESRLVSEDFFDEDDERIPLSRDTERIRRRQSSSENIGDTELNVLEYRSEYANELNGESYEHYHDAEEDRTGGASASKNHCERSQDTELFGQRLNHLGGTAGERSLSAKQQRSCRRSFLSRFGRASHTAPRFAP